MDRCLKSEADQPEGLEAGLKNLRNPEVYCLSFCLFFLLLCCFIFSLQNSSLSVLLPIASLTHGSICNVAWLHNADLVTWNWCLRKITLVVSVQIGLVRDQLEPRQPKKENEGQSHRIIMWGCVCGCLCGGCGFKR